ncbi:methionine--tRNA ligase, cytoplasmic isoform X1 [Schistocerca serialis cubense]|uniref:methionine--tRNA ligase, cytoplasmic isoform X1 n=1 Tax=Schistocerca serialis cubense TaxID=2023355 RepID=UPI00214F4DF6|nr:methionine--tRNA ligase, cytoplasmic isoform X1 [Schistocerca serialis cubense]
MRIFTSGADPSCLKVAVAANFAKENIHVENIPAADRKVGATRRLPTFQLESGTTLFSANSAARLLVPPKNEDGLWVDQWLEWEATKLQPVIVNCLTTMKSAALSTQLNDLLTTLDGALSTKGYLVHSSVTVADICIWSTIFPLAADAKLSSDWLNGKKHLLQWFAKLKEQDHIKEAVGLLKLKPGLPAIQSLNDASWFPLQATQCEVQPRPELISTSSTESSTKEPPISEAELEAAADAWKNGAARRPKPKPKTVPVLPVEGEKNVLVTSALPYVNNVPHLGNIIGCVLSADVFARFSRLCNHNVLYICGTDEYGTATETKALEEGLTPKEICDKYFKIHDAVYKWFNINFDYFGRTTSPEQTKVCQEIFLQLNRNGFICTEVMEQLLCEKCDRFLADRFVEGTCPRCAYEDARGDQCDGCGHLINATELIKPRCKLCQNTPVIKPSEQFFLKMPDTEPLIRHWGEKVWGGWSNNARTITRSWLKEGLKPRCITRDLKWGIPVPLDGYRNKVFYVWFDAPLGYISITSCYTSEWKQWWQPKREVPVSLYQFMAKDNVPFHAVLFPAILLGANQGYTVPTNIMATEYLNYEDGKFSKSRGVGVFGNDAQETGIPSDIWRFYLLYVRPESQDSSFSWADLAMKNNSELLNNLGNFIHRALSFVEKFFGGEVPCIEITQVELTLLAHITRELQGYIASLESARLRDGIRHILTISRHGNQFMQSQQPWVLVKGSETDRVRAGTVVGLCTNIAALLAVLLKPYMPETSRTLDTQLNAPEHIQYISKEVCVLLPPGHKIGQPAPLFTKIETAQIEKLKKQFSGRQRSPPAEKPVPVLSGEDIVAHLEAAIAKQGNVVREMKARGAPKEEWQPHVAVLLDLKKQLEAAHAVAVSRVQQAQAAAAAAAAAATCVSPPQVNGAVASPEEIARLETEVNKQGNLVREMKSSGKSKAEWQPEVVRLLELKKQLALAQGIDLTAQQTVSKPRKGKTKT